jgi:hypothetical protein
MRFYKWAKNIYWKTNRVIRDNGTDESITLKWIFKETDCKDESITLKWIFKETDCKDVDCSQLTQERSLVFGFQQGLQSMELVIKS